MEAKELADKIFEIKNVLEKNDGMSLFAYHRTKMDRKIGFESWLKVELCGILCNEGKVEPEKYYYINSKRKKIDIIFKDKYNDKWAISLSDIVKGTYKLEEYFNEFEKRPYSDYTKKCLVFLTFWPDKQENKDEELKHFIEKKNKIPKKIPFKFKNGIEGQIWFVLG